MVVLLQCSSAVQASQGKYIIQECPVTFFEKNAQSAEFTQKIEEKQDVQEIKQTSPKEEPLEQETVKTPSEEQTLTPEVKEETPTLEQKQEIQEIEQEQNQEQEIKDVAPVKEEVEEPSSNNEVSEQEQPSSVEKIDNKPEKTPKVKKEIFKKQPKEVAAEKNNAVDPTVVQNFAEIFDKSLDNAFAIVDNADIIGAKGMLLMFKAILEDTPEYQDSERIFSEIEKDVNAPANKKALFELKNGMKDMIINKAQELDFSTLPQEKLYMWGQGYYVVSISQIRCENVLNDLSVFYKIILDGKVSSADVKNQLIKADNLRKDIKNSTMDQIELLSSTHQKNVENKINISIPEKEQVKINPNGITYSAENQLNETNALFIETLENLMPVVGDEEFLVNEQKNNPERSKEDVYLEACAKGLDEILNNLRNNPSSITKEQLAVIGKNFQNISIIVDSYNEIVNSSRTTLKKINKDKLLKKAAEVDILKLNGYAMESNEKGQSATVIKDRFNEIRNLLTMNHQ